MVILVFAAVSIGWNSGIFYIPAGDGIRFGSYILSDSDHSYYIYYRADLGGWKPDLRMAVDGLYHHVCRWRAALMYGSPWAVYGENILGDEKTAIISG